MSCVQLPELALLNILSPSKQRDTKPQKSRDPFQTPGSLMIHSPFSVRSRGGFRWPMNYTG